MIGICRVSTLTGLEAQWEPKWTSTDSNILHPNLLTRRNEMKAHNLDLLFADKKSYFNVLHNSASFTFKHLSIESRKLCTKVVKILKIGANNTDRNIV